LFLSAYDIRDIKAISMRWAGHMAWIGEMGDAYKNICETKTYLWGLY
jgi:hypothetical protein